MTRRALSFTLEERPSARAVSQLDVGRGVESRADERDDACELVWLQAKGRHAAGCACRNHACKILVRGRASKQAASQIDAGDQSAVAPVALIALAAVEHAAPRH